MDDALFAVLFLLIWFVCLVIIMVAVGMYILRAVAFQKLLRKYNYRKSWMAWIPFAQYYALADAAAEGKPTMKLFSGDCPVWWFKFWYIITFAAAYIPFIGAPAIFVFKMFFLGSVYRTIYARCENRTLGSRTALGFFSAIIELIPIIKFLHYNKDKITPAEEPERGPVLISEAVPAAAPAPAPVYAPVPAAAPAPVYVPAPVEVPAPAVIVPAAPEAAHSEVPAAGEEAASEIPAPAEVSEDVKPEEPVSVAAEAPAEETALVCPNCGKAIIPGSVFCRHCGTRLIPEN